MTSSSRLILLPALLLFLLSARVDAAGSSLATQKALFQKGKAAYLQKDFPRAARLWLKLVRQRPSASLWANVGLALEKAERPDKAQSAYRRALALDGSHPKATKALARLTTKSEPVPPKDPKILDPATEVAKRIQRSEDLLQDVAIAPAPEKAEKAWSQAHEYRQLAKFSNAILAFVTAYSSGYAQSEVDYYLGRTCMEDEHIPSALVHLQRARDAVPEDQGIHLQLGKAYALLGDSQLQVESFEKALVLDPQFAEAHYFAALAYDGMGASEKVVEHAQKAIRIDPSYREKLQRGLKDGPVVRGLGDVVRASLDPNGEAGRLDPSKIDGYAAQVAQLLYGDSPLHQAQAMPEAKRPPPAPSRAHLGRSKTKELSTSFLSDSPGSAAPEEDSFGSDFEAPGGIGMGGSEGLDDAPPPQAESNIEEVSALSDESLSGLQVNPKKTVQATVPLKFSVMRKIFQDLHSGKGRRSFEHIPAGERAAFLRTFLTKLRQSSSLDPIRIRVETALRE